MMLTTVQDFILKAVKAIGAKFEEVSLLGDDALVFHLACYHVIVRYFPEIESFQIRKRNLLTNKFETNISIRNVRLHEVF